MKAQINATRDASRSMRARRRAAIAVGGWLAALLFPLVAPPGASADPAPGDPGYSANPYYFARDELPSDIPFGLSRSPGALMTVADLRSGEPTCAAPPPLPATAPGSPDGYTMPVRIKLTNGIMLAGYSAAAARYGQGVPFSTRLTGLTGWVNARVELPSLKLIVDPGDVTFCDGAEISIAYMDGSTLSPDYGCWDVVACYPERTQPDDGSSYVPLPATLNGDFLFGGNNPPSGRLTVRDIDVKSVAASVTGLSADGSLKLSVALKLDTTVAREDGDPNFVFPIGISGTFSTAVKQPVTPTVPDAITWDFGTPGFPERRSYLPARTLPGATVGRTATIGSNSFDFDETGLDALPGNSNQRNLASTLSTFMFGVDKYGTDITFDQPWGDNYGPWISQVIDGSLPFPDFSPGVADVSVDMTIDSLGLPKGIPAGFGWSG